MINKRFKPEKLVALFMGVFLSFVVSLPVFGFEYTPVNAGGGDKIDLKTPTKIEGKDTYLCSNYHCNTVKGSVLYMCNLMEWGSGHVMSVGDKECFCKCSCLASWTKISMADGTKKEISQISKGDVITVMGLGKLSTAIVYAVTKSVVNNYLAHQITFDNGKILTGSENHAIIDENDELVTFKSLNIGDKVRQFDRKLVAVTAKDKVNYDKLELFNIVINEGSSVAATHLIVTEDIYSADWLLQTNNDVSEKPIEVLWDKVDLSYVTKKPLTQDHND